jgi:phospholipid/cholesterol/gamma-HCH transport system substrate-binding protein
MHMTRRIWIQIAIFTAVSLVAFVVMSLGFLRVPSFVFGVDRYTVTVELPAAGGLYQRANVTYRGTEVGEVKEVRLTDTGVEAVMSLKSDIKIPSDLEAEVHSQSAVGEQYVALLPRNATSAPLRNGDVIRRDRTTVPPDINELLASTNRGLEAIPGDSLKTAVDEAYTALGGLGPELARFIKGGSTTSRRYWTPRPTRRTTFKRGRPIWRPSPRSCRPTTPRCGGCSRMPPRPPTSCASSSTA